MNNSVATTGGISFAGATLLPIIQWLLPTIPTPVAVSFAAAIITVGHALHVLAVAKGWYPQPPVVTPKSN